MEESKKEVWKESKKKKMTRQRDAYFTSSASAGTSRTQSGFCDPSIVRVFVSRTSSGPYVEGGRSHSGCSRRLLFRAECWFNGITSDYDLYDLAITIS